VNSQLGNDQRCDIVWLIKWCGLRLLRLLFFSDRLKRDSLNGRAGQFQFVIRMLVRPRRKHMQLSKQPSARNDLVDLLLRQPMQPQCFPLSTQQCVQFVFGLLALEQFDSGDGTRFCRLGQPRNLAPFDIQLAQRLQKTGLFKDEVFMSQPDLEQQRSRFDRFPNHGVDRLNHAGHRCRHLKPCSPRTFGDDGGHSNTATVGRQTYRLNERRRQARVPERLRGQFNRGGLVMTGVPTVSIAT